MKKFVSILLCYCILMLPTGCRSSKLLTTDEAETMKGAQNYLVLHTPTRNYKIYNYKFTNDSIEGDLRFDSQTKMHTINLYTKLNFYINLNSNSSQFIRLAKSDITKITYREFSSGKTIGAVLGGIGILGILGIIVAFSSLSLMSM